MASSGLAALSKTVVGVDPEPENSLAELKPGHPNPTSSSSTIRFTLPKAQEVTLEVFDLAGRQMASLIDHRNMAAGPHQARFDVARLKSGVYLYRLETGSFRATKKLLVVH
jgi:hypothetical protein